MRLPCYICDQMHSRKPDKHGNLQTSGSTQTCVLCNRDFCEVHKGTSDRVCEINHITYFAKHRNLTNIYATIDDVPDTK
jgi:hypothetical protein